MLSIGAGQIINDLRLAVTAPWGVELKENILVVVNHNLVIVLRNDNSDRAFLLLWDGLRLDAWLDLSGDEVINELADFLLSELLGLVIRKLLVVVRLLNSESGELADLEVEVGGMLTESLGVNSGEVDGALVLDGEGLQLFGKLLTLFGGLGENVGEGDTSLFNSVSIN